MTTVIIKSFKSKEQNRIAFIRLLTDYNSSLGLRRAKDKMDSMTLHNEPIEYQIDESRFDAFKQELINLNIEFEIK